MNRGTPKQQQLEAEFVSSTQSKHYERIQCALAISLETDISKDAREIERFGGCKNILHTLSTEHPALSYGRLLTFGTLAKVLYSKLEDGMNDMLNKMKEDMIEKEIEGKQNDIPDDDNNNKVENNNENNNDNDDDNTNSIDDEATIMKRCIDYYHDIEILCIRRVVSAILYLLTEFEEEVRKLEAEGWAQSEEPGKKHPLLQAIDDNKYELLTLIHKTQERMMGKEDAFEVNNNNRNGKLTNDEEQEETSDSLLHMIERPTIQCLNDCSRIISILSQNDLKQKHPHVDNTSNGMKPPPRIETFMQTLNSMQFHSDLLGNVIIVRSRVDNIVKTSLIEKADNFKIFQESEINYKIATENYEKAAEAAKRGLKTLKDKAKIRRNEFDIAESILNTNTKQYEASLKKYKRSKGVELTLQIILTSTVEAIGYLGRTLESAKKIAIDTFTT